MAIGFCRGLRLNINTSSRIKSENTFFQIVKLHFLPMFADFATVNLF